MHGSTSPSKNRCPACSQRQVAPTSATTSRTGSASGSMPKSRSNVRLGSVAVQGWPLEKSPRKSAGKHVPPAHWPSSPRSASNRAAHPCIATRARSADTACRGASVRSRSTRQRSVGSESSSQSRPAAENRPGSRQLRRVSQGCSTAAEVSVDLPETLGHRALCSSPQGQHAVIDSRTGSWVRPRMLCRSGPRVEIHDDEGAPPVHRRVTSVPRVEGVGVRPISTTRHGTLGSCSGPRVMPRVRPPDGPARVRPIPPVGDMGLLSE